MTQRDRTQMTCADDLGRFNITFLLLRVACTNSRRTWQVRERSVYARGLAAGLTTERVAVPAPTILRQRFPAVVRQGFHESVDGDHIGPCASNGAPAFNDLVITPVVHVPWIVQFRYLEQAVRTDAAGNEMGLVLLDS